MTDAEYEKLINGSFGQCLGFLLFINGARAPDSKEKQGVIWNKKEFAFAVGVTDRAVRDWLADRKTPLDLKAIEIALFDPDQQNDLRKSALRHTHSQARQKEASDAGEVGAKTDLRPAPSEAIVSEGPTQILHPEIHPVRDFTGRGDLLDTLDRALWQHGGAAALTNAGGPASPPLPGGEGGASAPGEGVHTTGGSQSPHPNPVPPRTFTVSGKRSPSGEGTDGKRLHHTNSVALTNSAAIHGLGGVGKSVLAQEYGWRNRERYRGVWWLRAEQPETLLDDLIQLGSRLGVPAIDDIREKDRAAHLALDAIRDTATDKPWLLVYDNAESPAAIGKLTPRERAHLIVTSCWSDWHGHAEPLPVDVFPPEVAADYLMAHARHPDRAAAKRLAEALGYLPLALSHARATCWASNLDFDSYRERLSEQLYKAPRGADYPQSVYATFDLAIRKAASLCPQAERLMEIAALFASDRIPVSLFTDDIMSVSERDDALAALYDLSLITHETLEDGARAFTVHRLVQAVMRDRLGDGVQSAQQIAFLLIHNALRTLEVQEHINWLQVATLLPHALKVLDSAPNDYDGSKRTGEVCAQLGAYFYGRGAYPSAEPLLERALAIVEAALGPDHPETGISLNNLAGLYDAQARYEAAEPLYERALAIAEAALGLDHPVTGKFLNNLAGLYDAQGRYEAAEPLYERALAIAEATLGPDHPETGISLNNLAKLYRAQGRYEATKPLLERALTIAEASLGPGHPATAASLHNLAELYRAQARYEAAKPLYERTLAILEVSLGSDHPTTQRVKANYEALKAAMAARDEKA